MDNEMFKAIVKDARNRQSDLLNTKGADYTRQDPDRLSNFKRIAEALGLTPIKVCTIFAYKHWEAIMTYVKTGKVESEEIEGRLDDLCNYMYLLEALIIEEKG